MNEWIWLGFFVLLLVVEIATMGLATIWFAGGALIAFIAAMLGANLMVQIILFFVVSGLLLAFTRPIAIKYLDTKTVKTNADRIIGEEVIITKEYNPALGVYKVVHEGMEWSAKTHESEEELKKGDVVIVEEIQGVKLLVKRK